MFFKVLYSVVLFFCRILCKLVFFITAEGKQNIPKNTGAFIAANHQSAWDSIVLALYTGSNMNFVAKAEIFKNKLFSWFLKGIGAISISRGTSDIKAVKSILSALKNKKKVLIFPEGTRKETATDEVKSGTVLFAIKGKVPVVPAHIIGEYKPFHKIKIVFGEPISYEKYYAEKPSNEELHKLSVELINKIYSLSEDK